MMGGKTSGNEFTDDDVGEENNPLTPSQSRRNGARFLVMSVLGKRIRRLSRGVSVGLPLLVVLSLCTVDRQACPEEGTETSPARLEAAIRETSLALGFAMQSAVPDERRQMPPQDKPGKSVPHDDEGWEDETWDDDEQWEEAESEGRAFLYKELVFSGFYSPEGVVGVAPDDRSEDHFEFNPRPPGNYIGLDYVRTFTSASPINRKLLPDWLPLTAIDLHPRLLFDHMEESDDNDQFKFAPQDFWVRFNPGNVDRLSLRVGQFVIPYGVNPILAPRQRFILPIEATDLGLKWDWGVDLKGPAGEHDWELAATIGSGEALHSPHLFQSGSERSSYLLTGRIGAPTYWDFQYGLSFLVGDLPMIRGSKVFTDASVARWRVALDQFYKYGTYLMMGGQLTYGQDGIGGDDKYVMITMGETADVLGWRVWMDWVVPMHQDLRLGAQYESVNRDLATTKTDDSAVILEASYSLSTKLTLRLDYRIEMNRSMGKENDGVYLTLVYYGL